MLVTWEQTVKEWAESGYIAIKLSEATDSDKVDRTKVIIQLKT